jgi:DUF1680 family protein
VFSVIKEVNMPLPHSFSRRQFLQTLSIGAFQLSSGLALPVMAGPRARSGAVLEEFDYGAVQFDKGLPLSQLDETMQVILQLSDDSLLKPFRQRAGMAAPGAYLGGWYDNFAGCDFLHGTDHGFAPGHSFGQWVSALARTYAITGSAPMQDKMQRLLLLYAEVPPEKFYKDHRFPAYIWDKMVLALSDAGRWGQFAPGNEIMNQTTDAVLKLIPEKALDHDEMRARPHIDETYCWDESYTLPENLFIAYERGSGARYKDLAIRYLKDDTYFNPLSEGKNILPGHHAYSYTNALSSAMKAYLVTGSEKHFNAAKNAFDMIAETQSFATGGWGPDETFVEPGQGKLAESLEKTHNSFETPCGAYAHFKLTRYLLRTTRQARYGDSMEQVMYNTVLGAKPLKSNGDGFYYSDYNFSGSKFYHSPWACCTGTLPQIAADYHVSAYFKTNNALFVNLYIPSSVTWQQDGMRLVLKQSSNYPLDGAIIFDVDCSKPHDLTIHFRIPAWAGDQASILVNGKDVAPRMVAGGFAAVRRVWRKSDKIELELPLPMRLVAVDARRLNVVALMRGPLVLFALTSEPPKATREQLLAARRVSHDTWQVEAWQQRLQMVPFTSIDEQKYSTYLHV